MFFSLLSIRISQITLTPNKQVVDFPLLKVNLLKENKVRHRKKKKNYNNLRLLKIIISI
jgi:hypothetical protein